MKSTPFILILFGLLTVWLGFNGTLGTFFASLITPSEVEIVK